MWQTAFKKFLQKRSNFLKAVFRKIYLVHSWILFLKKPRNIDWNAIIPHQVPANIYLLKFNNRNTRKRCEICSKFTIKTPEWRHWRRFAVFIVNFEHILVPFSIVSLVDFEEVNISYKRYFRNNIAPREIHQKGVGWKTKWLKN